MTPDEPARLEAHALWYDAMAAVHLAAWNIPAAVRYEALATQCRELAATLRGPTVGDGA